MTILALQGAKNMRKTLKAAGADLKDLTPAFKAAAGIAANAARSRAPRRTGALAGTVRATAGFTQGTVRAGNAGVPYAPAIHWGWPRRGIAAQPWVSEAAQSTEPMWITEFENLMTDAINQIEGVGI